MVVLYLVTTGWIFDISLYENSIDQSLNGVYVYIYIYIFFFLQIVLWFFTEQAYVCRDEERE